MKQHIEFVTKVKNVKEIQTKGGKFLYTFSIPITKMIEEHQLTEWLQVAILQDQQRKDVMSAKEVHLTGNIVLKEAYGDRPQGLSVFGFYIEPILTNVYRQSKVKKNTTEDASQQPNSPENASVQGQSNSTDSTQFPDMDQSDVVPF